MGVSTSVSDQAQPHADKPLPWWQHVSIAALFLTGGALLSEWLGQDSNYDLGAYHLYNGAALLNGWFDRDLMTTDAQSYFNPLLDSGYAFLALGPLRHAPRVLAGVMGLPAGATALLAWHLARRLYPGRPLLASLATALGVSGAVFGCEIGTTFNDIPVTALMLGGLLAVLAGPGVGSCLLAGLLFGAAAGLKLTALVYAPAALAAVFAIQQPRSPRSLATGGLIFAAGWALGWLPTDGWWALGLWRRFGNPVFPLMNGVFHSAWYPPASFFDDRFLPAGFWQAVVYPIYWFLHPRAVGEVPLQDPRGALFMLLGLAALVVIVIRRPPIRTRPAAIMLFVTAGFVGWVATTGIIRYAIVLEVLAGLTLPLLLGTLLQRRAFMVGLAGLAAVTLATTRYGSYGRVPYGPEAVWADTGWVQPGTLIVATLRKPAAHILPLLPFQQQIAAVGLGFLVLDARGWRLHDEVTRRIRAHDGPIMVLTGVDPSGRYAELGEVGLDPALHGCRRIYSTFVPRDTEELDVCPAHRLRPAPMPSAFWAQAAARYDRVERIAHGTGAMIGQAYLDAAGPAARGTQFLDWSDLQWNGVSHPRGALPSQLAPRTLYVPDADLTAALIERMDPKLDAIGVVDGVRVLAPGWRGCAACTAGITPLTQAAEAQ